jgi:type II restriction/modification system DNA methylase subunit YeeA
MLNNFPLPEKINQQSIVKHVEKILNEKDENLKTDTTEIEKEIDHLVYELYGLTDDEIKIIEDH